VAPGFRRCRAGGRRHYGDGLAEAREASTRERRSRYIERVGVEPDGEAIALLRHRALRTRRRVDRQPSGRAERVVADGDPRHPQVADDQKPRRLPEVEARIVNQREGPADEFDRHEPAPPAARRGGRQRDESPRNGRKRLLRRQENRLPFVGDREGSERLFPNGELECRGEVVERDELLIAGHGERQGAPAVLREERQRWRLRGLTGERRRQRNQERDSRRGGEKRKRADVQWRISDPRDPHCISRPLQPSTSRVRQARAGYRWVAGSWAIERSTIACIADRVVGGGSA